MKEINRDNINRLFRTMTARKISVLARLAGLNEEEINIMRLRWLENKSDVQICAMLNFSTATLGRKRRAGYKKIIDAMDLYGLTDLEELPAASLLDYSGKFYKAQDELIRYFMAHKDNEAAQDKVLDMLRRLNGDMPL